MQGVLYISHGSRVKEATDEAMTFLDKVKEAVDIPHQEICFLELAQPTVAQGIDRLVSRNVTTIAIVPVLLLSAGHYFKDIPEALSKSQEKYPEITFTYGQPLGVQERFTDALLDRIRETDTAMNEDTELLLVGRGSRNPKTKEDIGKIADSLEGKTGRKVHTAYLAACKPAFEEELPRLLEQDGRQLIVVPYLWFTGILLKSMQEKVEALRSSRNIQLTRQLGAHDHMIQALKDRVLEACEKDGGEISKETSIAI